MYVVNIKLYIQIVNSKLSNVLCNLSVLLVHLDVFMLILSIVVSLVHDHISYAVNLLSCLNICFIIIIIIIA